MKNVAIEEAAVGLAYAARYENWHVSGPAWQGWLDHALGMSARDDGDHLVGWLAREIWESLPLDVE